MTSRFSSKMARPLGVRGHQKQSNLIGSQKAGGACFVETADEAVTLLCLEVDPRVRSAKSQPFTVRLDIEQMFATRSDAVRATPLQRVAVVGGTTLPERIYTPDFLAELVSSEPWAIESKSSAAVSKSSEAIERRAEVLNRLGFHFLVVPSEELNHRGLRANLVNLRDAIRSHQRNDATASLRLLEDAVANQPAEFRLGAVNAAVPATTIYLGIATGLIGCDLKSGHLSVATKLWHAEGDLAHLQLLNLEET